MNVTDIRHAVSGRERDVLQAELEAGDLVVDDLRVE